ncbi:MAG TPA: 3-methyl-2-oxobutanoate hydroxymethyltransferase [bacterium]
MTIEELLSSKGRPAKLVMLTAYDYPLAKLLDEAGVDVILVGDSVAMVVLGRDDTTAVGMEEMLHHAKAVRRGTTRALLIGDMPFGSFHSGAAEAARNARRFVEEAGCDAVKIEWISGVVESVRAITAAGVPVMGHVGLTPQTAAREGGYGMRGKRAEAAADIIGQADALQGAGCFALVVECVPAEVAGLMTERLSIPVFGIGSGPDCDGQVVVTHDLLGLYDRFTPRFVRRYADLGRAVRQAAEAYAADVRRAGFPGADETVHLAPEEHERLLAILAPAGRRS